MDDRVGETEVGLPLDGDVGVEFCEEGGGVWPGVGWVGTELDMVVAVMERVILREAGMEVTGE